MIASTDAASFTFATRHQQDVLAPQLTRDSRPLGKVARFDLVYVPALGVSRDRGVAQLLIDMQSMNLVVIVLLLQVRHQRLMNRLSFGLLGEHRLVKMLFVLVSHVVSAVHADDRV